MVLILLWSKILLQNSIGSIINIYTLMWKTSKKCSPRCTLYRIFEIIGCVKSDGSVTSFSEFFPNWNFGFNRRHLLVTTIWVRVPISSFFSKFMNGERKRTNLQNAIKLRYQWFFEQFQTHFCLITYYIYASQS